MGDHASRPLLVELHGGVVRLVLDGQEKEVHLASLPFWALPPTESCKHHLGAVEEPLEGNCEEKKI